MGSLLRPELEVGTVNQQHANLWERAALIALAQLIEWQYSGESENGEWLEVTPRTAAIIADAMVAEAVKRGM